MIEVSGIHKIFGGLVAIDNLSFSVKENEIFSIIGPNGAGKTTLFNILSGVYKPDTGKILFEGKDITGLKPHVVAQKGLVRTFQLTTVFAQSTVLENLTIAYRLRTKSNIFDTVFGSSRSRRAERQAQEKAQEVLEFIELKDSCNKMASLTTQEEQKRLSIGIALATDPKVVMLDEPAGGLNPQEMDGIMSLIYKVKEKGITVCLIEHKMRIVMQISDRIMALNYGQKISEGTANEVSNDEKVIQAYLGVDFVA